ncbi:MAG: sensor histidine kinase KdpD [Proteobacteria bacterium]|nr:sensor histidine kinase KdpD [Pseudomonadota bacterium]
MPERARTAQADALIGELQRQRQGRLTLFLGAAPGVGKTYAMLGRARELRRRGVDVVVAIVETHGRGETAALVDGLDVLPRLAIPYRGHVVEEMDLDRLLARKPEVALVDELAHRNAPGSRHERRWQDVMELLDAGIDVYSTINIQHLESLNDVVHRITGVRVGETVPDAVFDRLRDIVLVDLPPGELIERLHQGKVYLPEQAAQALQSFFVPSNLAALRELAMQTAADRVDSDLREAQTARGVAAVPLRRQVIVAIDGRGQSEYLVRIARRLAERRNAPWTVVSVERREWPHDVQLEIDRALAMARRLGGATEVLHGDNVVDALLDYANRIGASSIVIGRTRDRPLARLFNRAITQQLIQRGAHFEIVIVSTPEARAESRKREGGIGSRLRLGDFWQATLISVVFVAIAAVAKRWLDISDLSMIFIVAVLVVATRTRVAAALYAAVLCFFAYDFFFIPPYFTLYISAQRGVTTALLFLVTALLAGRLAARLRTQVVALRASNAHATALESLSRDLAAAADPGDVERAGRNALKRVLGARAIVHLGSGTPASDDLDDKALAAAQWTFAHGQPAGRFTATLSACPWWFLPLRGNGNTIGWVGLRMDDAVERLAAEQQRLAEAMTDDIAQAALRTRLVGDLQDARMTGETERLRSALLSSVSHDLRSPLAAIIGSASSLQHYGAQMDGHDRDELLDTIRTEGQRLDRYIQNLLDMTRLGHGGLKLNRDWIGVDEVVGAAVERICKFVPGALVEVDIESGLAPLWVHPALVEQALFNIIENAAKFSPPGKPVRVQAGDIADGALQVDIIDQGPGIPEADRARIFDMFYSVERGDRGRHGTGLGLTIAQGMIGAHGGAVAALPGRDGRGTCIRITLPRTMPDAAHQ